MLNRLGVNGVFAAAILLLAIALLRGTAHPAGAAVGDADQDGYSDASELALGKDPSSYCAIMRADVNNDGSVNALDLNALAKQFSKTVPPAPDRLDQGPVFDGNINGLDLSKMSKVFSWPVSACDVTPTPTSAPTPTVTPTVLPGTRDKTLWPFASTSIWNMPIGSSATYVPAGITPRGLITVDNEYIVITSSADPVVPFYVNGIWGPGRCATTSYRYSLNVPASLVIEDATRSSTPNNAAAFLSPDGRTIHQMNPASRCAAGGPLTAGWAAPDEDIYGAGALGGHGGSGLSGIGGSLRSGELTGVDPIRHALKVNLWGHAFLSPANGGHRWPAVTADSFYDDASNPSHYAGPVPQLRMGSLLAIPKTVNVDALGLKTAAAKKLAWTLQNYGAYVVDDTTYDADALDVQAGVGAEFQAAYGLSIEASSGPWYDDAMVLFATLSVVDNNAPGSIGGGGAPSQPLAPAIGN